VACGQFGPSKVWHVNLAAREPPQRIGTVIADKYRIVRELGRGGMGAVYEAVHTGIGKHVALKFHECDVEPDARIRARFLREAQTASLVESPHIVHIFDSGCTADGTPFLVLELLRGEDLRARLRREGRLSIEEAVTIIEQTLRALARTHAAGIVHRDLKPENVFLCEQDGLSILVKILDFGISKVTRAEMTLDTLTHEGVVLGTAYYMSPEQARGEIDLDGRSDLYGLGAIFYEMLTGRTPHVGNVYHAVLVDICTRDADDVRLLAPHVPEPIAKIIARALSRDRLERFSNAQDFLDALAPYASARLSPTSTSSDSATTRVSQPAMASPHSASNAGPSRTPRTLGGKIVAGLLLLAIVGAAVSIVVVHKRFKSQQASHNAQLLAQTPTLSGSQIALPAVASAPVTPTTLGAPTQTSASSRGSLATARRNSPDAGTASRRVTPRASTGNVEELQLKTTMP
jgi:serine/threonine protein kinase